MIPIIKNISVVDEQGKNYGATYPKRAKGLVKHGRARFIDDDVICLACPPNTDYLEDIKMNNDKLIQDGHASVYDSGKYTWEYAVEQIEKIANDTEHIKEALKSIEAIGESIDGTGSSKADAIKEAIKSREETNRKLIMFYQSMYEETKPNQTQNKDVYKKMIVEKLISINFDELDDQSDFINKLISFID